ncbi:ankyrin repeat domain-containing protein, partial [Oligoflexia bacterium]|nr:ankyrin repeat domain-containing protein [Oligoflexia bacterium]
IIGKPKMQTIKIHIAAQNGDVQTVEKELREGVDVNAPDEDGYTALHWACQEGYLQVVEPLLKMKADVTIRDVDGYHALEIAATKGHYEIAKTLIDNGADVSFSRDGFTALHAAAASGSAKIVQLLLECGADVNARDANGKGRLPLHWAAQEGYLKTSKILINNHSQIDGPDEHGFTPLGIAVPEGHLELVKLFIQCGADVDAKCSSYENSVLLHTACAWGRKEIAEILLDNGADTNIEDDDGFTPLDIATQKGNRGLIKLLKDKTSK